MATGERTYVDSDEGSSADQRGAIKYSIEVKGKAERGLGRVRRPYHDASKVPKNCLSENAEIVTVRI